MPADVPADLTEAVRKAGFPNVDEALKQVFVATMPRQQYLEFHESVQDTDYVVRVLASAGDGRPGLSDQPNDCEGTTFAFRDVSGKPIAVAALSGGETKRIFDLAVDPRSTQAKMGMMMLLDHVLKTGVLSMQDALVTKEGARVQHVVASRQVARLDAETRKKLEAMLTYRW